MSLRLPLVPDGIADRPAVMDSGTGGWVSYGELSTRAQTWADRLSGPRSLVFHYINNSVDDVAALLGAIAAGHAVALFDPKLAGPARVVLEQRYLPEWVIEQGIAHSIKAPSHHPRSSINPALALLLSTSGSTGSPKLVRLSAEALQANAEGIAEVLHISGDDVAAGYLPLHYSYGLSVLLSHLCRGARILLTNHGLTDRAFWPALRSAEVTHMPGVPFHFQIMSKLGFARLGLASLRSLSQAGGHLDVETRRNAHAFMSARGGHFFVLYGQTEAAPRMTTLQHDEFDAAEASVGTALPGCRIEILNADETGNGEVVFHGPNVMLGYANERADLALGNEQNGRLHTGDIGYLDNAGRLFITGRVKRFAKVYGLRVNLDELESAASAFATAAVVQNGEGVRIFVVTSEVDYDRTRQAIQDHLLERFTLPRAAFDFVRIDAIPTTERGKIDYATLGRI